jgi:hypothetical protein
VLKEAKGGAGDSGEQAAPGIGVSPVSSAGFLRDARGSDHRPCPPACAGEAMGGRRRLLYPYEGAYDL